MSGYTYREEDILGNYTQRGLLRYKDPDAYYCQACGDVVNVQCPRCKVRSGKGHTDDNVFVRASTTFERYDGFIWTQISCRKCDYLFKVIAR